MLCAVAVTACTVPSQEACSSNRSLDGISVTSHQPFTSRKSDTQQSTIIQWNKGSKVSASVRFLPTNPQTAQPRPLREKKWTAGPDSIWTAKPSPHRHDVVTSPDVILLSVSAWRNHYAAVLPQKLNHYKWEITAHIVSQLMLLNKIKYVSLCICRCVLLYTRLGTICSWVCMRTNRNSKKKKKKLDPQILLGFQCCCQATILYFQSNLSFLSAALKQDAE